MDKYKVNNIFDDNALTLDELISSFFLSFLDEDLKFNDITRVLQLSNKKSLFFSENKLFLMFKM